VPDQHAAFGITKATRETREPVWRDLRLAELVRDRQNVEGEAQGGAQSGGGEGSSNAAERGNANANGPPGGVQAVGPAVGGVRVPIGVRAGMRGITADGVGSDLRS
jgi:hypothetical protein